MYKLTPTFFEAVFLSTSGLQEEASWIDLEIMKEGRERGDRCSGTQLTETDIAGLGESLTLKARLDTKSTEIWACFCVHIVKFKQVPFDHFDYFWWLFSALLKILRQENNSNASRFQWQPKDSFTLCGSLKIYLLYSPWALRFYNGKQNNEDVVGP